MELDFLPDAGHDAVEDEEKVSADDIEVPVEPSENSLIIPIQSATSDNPSVARRKSAVVHHVGRDKPKRWRANMGGNLPHLRCF